MDCRWGASDSLRIDSKGREHVVAEERMRVEFAQSLLLFGGDIGPGRRTLAEPGPDPLQQNSGLLSQR